MRKVFFNEGYQKELTEKGYITVPMLADDEISYLSEEFIKLRPDIFSSENTEIDMTHCTVYEADIEYRRKADNLIREVFSSHIKDILADYRIQACNFFVKPPWKGKVNAHLHPYMVSDFNDTVVTLWCPLVDADELNGTLQVIEKSHKIIPEIPIPCAAHSFSAFEEKLFEKYMTPISLKAGNSLIFDDTLIHGSERNNSSAPRPAVQLTCLPSDTRPVFFFLDRNKPDRDFEVFEIDSDLFVEHGITGLVTPPANLKKIGTVKNKNRPITETEFINLLAKGDETRGRIYSGEKPATPDTGSSFLKKIKSYLNF